MAFSLKTLASGMFSRLLLNNNFEKIEDKVNNDLVHRQNGSAQMQQDLDMNSNEILNVNDPTLDGSVANKRYVDSRDNFFFDEFHTTVGFYLPRGQSVSLIQLRGRAGENSFAGEHIDILVSDDNQKWVSLIDEVEISVVNIDGRTIVALKPPSGSHRYWKINFNSPTREKSFSGNLHDMLQVFGYSNRGGA